MEPIKPQESVLNNYSNKSIQFYKKDNRYILIFADVFFPDENESISSKTIEFNHIDRICFDTLDKSLYFICKN